MGSRSLAPWRLGAAVVLAGVVVVVAWQTGGFFATDNSSGPRNLTATRILLFLVIACAFYLAPGLIRRTGRPAAIAFSFWTIYLTAWLLAVWPGIVMTDTAEVAVQAKHGVVLEWFSWVQSVLNIAVLDLVPNIAALGVLQVLATAAAMAYATHVLLHWRDSPWAAVAMNVVAALSVPIVVNALLLTRDALYTVLQLVLALGVAQVVTRTRPATSARIVWFAVLAGLLSVWRGDGIILLVLTPLLLLLALRPSRRRLVQGALVFVAAGVLFHVALPAAFAPRDESMRYQLALRINPLGAVLRSNFYSEHKSEDLRQLGRMVDVAAVRDMWDPSEIPAYWAGKWNVSATKADFQAFKTTADRLILENLTVVLAAKVQTFGGATGLGPGQFTGLPLDRKHRFSFIAERDGIADRPPSNDLYDAAASVLNRTAGYTGAISTRSALFWNFLPWLALLLVVLAIWRRVPFIAVVSVLMVCRLPLLFLVAPASQFKYYLSIELGGIVVLGLLLAMLRSEDLRRLRTRTPWRRHVPEHVAS